MEDLTHWATVVKCSICGEIPEYAPLYQCPFQHQYCLNCFNELKKKYRGPLKNGCTCVICKVSGTFTQSKITTDFLNKIRRKPGIGRSYRYNANPLFNTDYNYTRVQQKASACQTNGVTLTVESLFQLPTAELNKLLNKKQDLSSQYDEDYFMESLENNYDKEINGLQKLITPSQSRMPITCPHKPCKKVVAISSFVTHFKHEHQDIPKYIIERGKELCIPCDTSLIEHNSHYCLAMITVYEINKIDVKKSKSSQSVIKTCSKFSQQVPINSFWLMVSGSAERRPGLAYALYWLFTTSEDSYQSTIELSSKYDSVTFSTYCGINTSPQNRKFLGIAEGLNCLIVSQASLGSLLREGPDVNLRIIVH